MTFLDLVREPAIRVRLRSGWTLGRSADGASFVAEGPDLPEPAILGRHAPDFEAANARFAAGAPLAALRDAVVAAGGGARAAFYLVWLQRLCRAGFVEFPLADAADEPAVIVPQRPSFTPALAPAAPEASLDRFACIRRDGGAWLLESPLVGARFRFDRLAALDAPIVRRALAAAGFLETRRPPAGPPPAAKPAAGGEAPGTEAEPRPDAARPPAGATPAAPPAGGGQAPGTAAEPGPDAARRDALAQWEFHDLLFHTHSRDGWHRDPLGAGFSFIGEIEPLPAARPPWPGTPIPLARASAGGESFAAVLERRRSERYYDEAHPISRDDLGALLDRAARIRASAVVEVRNAAGRTAPFELTRRPYPNGGASYELEIYPVVDRCNGLEPGLYHYDAAGHALVRIAGRTPDVEQFFADAHVASANQAEPQIVLVIAARFARVTWKYKSICYATTLRNTGVLYQTLYLAATELGLSPCGLGSGDSALFARATGLDPTVEGSVGDVILGGRPRAPGAEARAIPGVRPLAPGSRAS